MREGAKDAVASEMHVSMFRHFVLAEVIASNVPGRTCAKNRCVLQVRPEMAARNTALIGGIAPPSGNKLPHRRERRRAF
jgi:hypothetical protein